MWHNGKNGGTGIANKVYAGVASAGVKVALPFKAKYIFAIGSHGNEYYISYDGRTNAFRAIYFDTNAVGHVGTSYNNLNYYIKIEDDGITFLKTNWDGNTGFFASTDE